MQKMYLEKAKQNTRKYKWAKAGKVTFNAIKWLFAATALCAFAITMSIDVDASDIDISYILVSLAIACICGLAAYAASIISSNMDDLVERFQRRARFYRRLTFISEVQRYEKQNKYAA